ncbi:MAG TPA: Ig-like domain-containing protein [Polyangiaceae bacterium]
MNSPFDPAETKRISRRHRAVSWAFALSACALAGPAFARHGELPNRIPEAAPYNTREAERHPPPYEAAFAGSGSPNVCAQCHERIFEEWNGSMMANAWRDPAWRGAFLLIARLVSTDGHCDIPDPPDGTKKNRINPFANDDCTSTFDLGTQKHTTQGSGSLLDGFCSRCHMPANYIDAVKLKNVTRDKETELEHGLIDPDFDPTSDRGTGFAFATVDADHRNTEPGKLGITCTFCHTIAETRDTPFHNYERSGLEYTPALGRGSRAELLPKPFQESFEAPAPDALNLGYGVGAGSYRVSPQALTHPERFGPLSHEQHEGRVDSYVSKTFDSKIEYQNSDFEGSIHKGSYHVLFERAEMCAACHDVTNPLTIKNELGRWVGGFPIERTYSEWAHSRYADRPGNENFNPAFKRDCQTCHMQQDYGRAGTAQTLFEDTGPVAPLAGKAAQTGPERPIYHSHHFVGGNSYSSRLVGANADAQGKAYPYPELSAYSYSSADPESPYYNAYWEGTTDVGPPVQQVRMAWDRLRNALELSLEAPELANSGAAAPIKLKVINSGTGHNFPTGFPEGRNAWVAVRAFDVDSGRELQIDDSFWKRRSLGVGYLTDRDSIDPSFPGCKWKVPAGSPDPYAWQFRAVASLGDGCPTLDLPYAAPLNMAVNETGLPIDASGAVIGRENPLGLPQFKDVDRDGDAYDDSFLLDNRLRPLPHKGATLELDRYSVVIPEGTVGPVAVSVAVYYQSMEAVVAKKFLGNLADTDRDHVLEPCVLNGPCDGRTPKLEPAVVEGSPPVPIRVLSKIINVEGRTDEVAPRFSIYPAAFETNAYVDAVIKVTASEPIRPIDAKQFRLTDAGGNLVPGKVAQIADYTWALFPDPIFLELGTTYHVKLDGPLCDLNDNCDTDDVAWSFTVSSDPTGGAADTRPPPPPAPLVDPSPKAEIAPQRTLPRGVAIAIVAAGAFLLGLGAAWVVGRFQPAASR